MPRIEEILHRRTDLSTFLVHLTRSRDAMTAKERLHIIYEERELIAGSPMGLARDQDDPDDETAQSQRVVCFSETPLEHSWALAAEIEGRQVQLEPYGVALPKYRARQLGVNPVWYVDMTTGHDWQIAHALDALRDEAIEGGDFHEQPVARVLPFVEVMGTWTSTGGTAREFWWEREWRHVGTLHIPPGSAIFMCPEDEIEEFVPRKDDEAERDWNRGLSPRLG